jgi:hypothetical protein
MLIRRLFTGLFWFFATAIALFSFAIALGIAAMGFQHIAPHLIHYAANYRVPLYLHIVFGPLALLLMPFQFWRGLRDRHRGVHRLLGYGYAVSIGIASIGSLLLLPRFQGSLWAASGFAVLAVLWVATTARGVMLARGRNTTAHRVWMMRSASLTFAAVVLRLITIPLMATGMTLTQSYDITAWASWLLPLAAVELSKWRPKRVAAMGT